MRFCCMRRTIVLLVLVALIPAVSALAQDLIPELEPFRPLIGKTWKGLMSSSASASPVYDVSTWERALNGKAIRIFHSVNNGDYGGETIIMWDQAGKRLIFFYFTTDGFRTNGTMEIEGKRFVSHEYVTGSKDGITEVKAVGELLSDGRLRSKATYFQGGKWVEGHEFIYVEAPEAKVVFK